MKDMLYNLGVATYRNAVRLASLRNRKAKLMLRGQRRTFRTLQRRLDPAGGYIWVHASSLGEFEQGPPPDRAHQAPPARCPHPAHLLLPLGL